MHRGGLNSVAEKEAVAKGDVGWVGMTFSFLRGQRGCRERWEGGGGGVEKKERL